MNKCDHVETFYPKSNFLPQIIKYNPSLEFDNHVKVKMVQFTTEQCTFIVQVDSVVKQRGINVLSIFLTDKNHPQNSLGKC